MMGYEGSIHRSGAARSTSPDSTAPLGYQVPVNLLESFIPGYSIVSRILLELFGVDVTVLVSICFMSFAVITCVNYIWSQASRALFAWFTSSISVHSGDEIHVHLMQWIGKHEMSRSSRSMLAVTVGSSNPSMHRPGSLRQSQDDENDYEEIAEESGNGILNFWNWQSRFPPRYEPYLGRHRFWHKGRLFFLFRELKQSAHFSLSHGLGTDQATITLTCIGRSPAPIKALIEEARQKQAENTKSVTVVRRPADAKIRQYGGPSIWVRVAARPSRPMDTVVLDPRRKAELIADINEYLHPSTRRWYANRGIPYRRGYLFHGPPGTGKTSLSFALAGLFGLEINVVSLLDTTITEESLMQLFNNLPRRCFILLEDIDSTGLTQQRTENADTQSDILALGGTVTPVEKPPSNSQLSLSGLLNAIDGVASHEGRVLLMTTNHPEKLDEALIRPGRVDLQVEFTLANRVQIKEIFVRMYASDEPARSPKPNTEKPSEKKVKPVSSNATKATQNGSMGEANVLTLVKSKKARSALPFSEIKAIADEFADQIEDYTLTPAEIQGFLLMRKNDPRKALAEVEKWRDGVLASKAAKAKVLSVH